MEKLGPAGEFHHLSEHYRGMSDGELLDLARQPSELTEMAQQALASEIAHRHLKVEPEKPAPPQPQVWTPPETPDADDPYDEDRRLVTLCTVWSQADAEQVQELLGAAAIPFFMGQEKATSVDAVTSNFAEGVDVAVMSIGLSWAREIMQHYEPINDQTPKEEKEEQDGELLVRCPKCRSTEVVFEELAAPAEGKPSPQILSPQVFKWICDSCGHEWEDNGVLKEE
jgi:predicted nucleic-acid-binding Zn-ribbon protein